MLTFATCMWDMHLWLMPRMLLQLAAGGEGRCSSAMSASVENVELLAVVCAADVPGTQAALEHIIAVDPASLGSTLDPGELICDMAWWSTALSECAAACGCCLYSVACHAHGTAIQHCTSAAAVDWPRNLPLQSNMCSARCCMCCCECPVGTAVRLCVQVRKLHVDATISGAVVRFAGTQQPLAAAGQVIVSGPLGHRSSGEHTCHDLQSCLAIQPWHACMFSSGNGYVSVSRAAWQHPCSCLMQHCVAACIIHGQLHHGLDF